MNLEVQKLIDQLPNNCYQYIKFDFIKDDLVCTIGFGYMNFNFRFDLITLFSRVLWKNIL